MLVQIAHENGCKKRFDVYCGGQKLKSGEEYGLPADAVLEFTEYNAAAGKLWFLRVFFAFVAGIVRGGFDDFLPCAPNGRASACGFLARATRYSSAFCRTVMPWKARGRKRSRAGRSRCPK